MTDPKVTPPMSAKEWYNANLHKHVTWVSMLEAFAAYFAAPLEAEITVLKGNLDLAASVVEQLQLEVGELKLWKHNHEARKRNANLITAEAENTALKACVVAWEQWRDLEKVRNASTVLRAVTAETENVNLKARVEVLETALHEIVDTLSPDDFAHWTQMARAALAGKGGQ
jgi:hypothetical protein